MTRFEDKICRVMTRKEKPKFCTNLPVTGGTLLKNGNVALASYGKRKVSIFRLTGQKIRDYKIQNPWDVAARLDCVAGELLFVSVLKSEKRSARIDQINLSEENRITTFTRNVVSPCGIAFTLNNELCVCEKKSCKLVIFGEDGGIIREIINTNFICPWYIAAKSHDELLLSDFYACCVWHLNSSGEIIEKFDKTSESDPTQFHPAKSVYSDRKIFISDQDGGKVRILSQTGQVRTVIARLDPHEDNFCPVILLADDNGHLIIVSKNGEVFVMQIPTEDMKIKIF
ncbi:tripartite motif-containing protein 2-like [Saccostrea echinata]|uniref:tripartite motif-containing protein 2-like n=1 Tax=Saccostrea echinata TaxID=191078 RepID=UPI002A8328C3|nr:tripartite motif-containing protein 2-like [Saccostrea echinata]